MSQQLSKLWLLGPPFAIAVSILAYYAVFPSFRTWVDNHFPWAATHVGVYLPVRNSDEQRQRLRGKGITQEPKPAEPVAAATPAPATPPPKPVYVQADGSLDLPKLAANHADWPKALTLRAAREFPAVVDGKSVGNVIVPKGTEVHLMKIEAGKLGLEYRGGGAWAEPAETELAEQVRGIAR